MRKWKQRTLALLLVLALTLGMVPGALAQSVAQLGSEGSSGQSETTQSQGGGLSLSNPLGAGSIGLEPNGQPASVTQADLEPAGDEMVTFIVELEQPSLLAQGYSTSQIANGTSGVQAYQARQEAALDQVKEEILAVVGEDQEVEFGYTYTIATTGMSLSTRYDSKQDIANLSGVERVYVAPTFQVPKTEEVLQPQTGNATGMIGAGTVNESGFTGKGMRIAIIDTGLRLDNPSFGALTDDQLTSSSLTRAELQSVWGNLKASQWTSAAAYTMSYYNNKVPYIYNYASHNQDVAHTQAGSDHGTHVAGIAAANKLSTTSVVGVAPDAQILAMQVFDGSGAQWDVVMAALEDCVPLKVDVANLSLGAAAGFTDDDANMMAVLNRLEATGVQVVIAAGNDTNSAYNNNLGGYPLSSNPDIGLVGTPSTYAEALSVASADNGTATQYYFTVNGRDIGFNDTGKDNLMTSLANQSLEFVVLEGYGDETSYTDVNVEGKVVVVSRGGGVSFQDKQSNAQSRGAVACVVYNNAPGIINMAVNTGAQNIPCVGISQTDGLWLKEQKSGTLTVQTGQKDFTQADTMSSFSSWGVTPNLELKPEITGVGGNIYSTRDPSYGGSEYGYMSGTSMASPQVAGAMAVLTQYLRDELSFAKNSKAWQVAANLLMSTANPMEYNPGVEYSPRQQGAGLVDLLGATSAQAYLSNPDEEHSRPKAELGESADGNYTFRFQITNLSNEEKTYMVDSSLLTETLVDGNLIGNQPYALSTEVQVAGVTAARMKYDFNGDGTITTADGLLLMQSLKGNNAGIPTTDDRYAYRDVNGDNTVNEEDVRVIVAYCAGNPVDVDLEETFDSAAGTIVVPAKQTVTLSASINLNDTDKNYLNQFSDGIYVEGYLYLRDGKGESAKDLVMPILGFYGDWSEPSVFDGDEGVWSIYESTLYRGNSATQLGYNPYFKNSLRTGEEYNAFSYTDPLYEIDLGLLRNAKELRFSVVNAETNEQYFTFKEEYITKSYFSDTYGYVMMYFTNNYYQGEENVWDGTNNQGQRLPDGTKVYYKVEALLDDGDDVVDDTWQVPITVDSAAPQVLNKDSLVAEVDETTGKATLTLQLQDSQYIAAVQLLNAAGSTVLKQEPGEDYRPGETYTMECNITGLGSTFTLLVSDYACNTTTVQVVLDNEGLDNLEPQPLDPDRIYGSENISVAGMVDQGWFSMTKQITDLKNVTFDTTSYFSGEYVNGRVVAQRNDGDLVVLTPYGPYWASQTVVESPAVAEGQANFTTLYDMALQYNDGATKDRLFAVGWTYDGTITPTGMHGGSANLYEIVFPEGQNPQIKTLHKLTGIGEDTEMVTLAITNEGTLYGISTEGILYTINPSNGACTSVRNVTEFTGLSGYTGVNVIQSMCYDHAQDVIYWAAHSQTNYGAITQHLCKVLKIDTSQDNCPAEVIGDMGHSGASALFIPTDKESDLMNLEGTAPTGMALNPATLTLLPEQTQSLQVAWTPWNAQPQTVTWSSEDEGVATVRNGVVTAVAAGTTTITATAGELSATCTVTVVASQTALYGFVPTSEAGGHWIKYSDQDPMNVTQIKTDGNLWQGGAYCDGELYTVKEMEWSQVEDGTTVLYKGTGIYKSTVDANGNIGNPTLFSRVADVSLGNLGFDYHTGRMYGVDLNSASLVIVELDTGFVANLGQFKLGEGITSSTMTAMTVVCLDVVEGKDKESIIFLGNMDGQLLTVNPDTLECKLVASLGKEYWNYGAMTYDYVTDNLYWSPSSTGDSPLLLVKVDATSAADVQVDILDVGDVQTAGGVEQTVMFTIPGEHAPEISFIPVESISIEGLAERGVLVGGEAQLTTVTVPARPTVQLKTWTSSNPDVVSVDKTGKVKFLTTGEATVTVSLTDRDGQVYTDSVKFTVYPAGGKLHAILRQDTATGYYGFWIDFADAQPYSATYGDRVQDIYQAVTGEYYEGYFYIYEEDGTFGRVDAKDHKQYTALGKWTNLNSGECVSDMAFDYVNGVMYALVVGGSNSRLMKVDLTNGSLTAVDTLSVAVSTLAADKTGALYAAGTQSGNTADLYKLTVNGNSVTTSDIGDIPTVLDPVKYHPWTYYPQMTYDYGTNRLYLNSYDFSASSNGGIYMVQLGDNGEFQHVATLGRIALSTGRDTKVGNAYLGLLAIIPEEGDLPEGNFVTGVELSATTARLEVGKTITLTASVLPAKVDQSVTWKSDNESIATVENGKVTAVKAGTAKITATSTKDGNFSATCTITVVETQSGNYAYALTDEEGLVKFYPGAAGSVEVVATPTELKIQEGKVIGMDIHENDVYYVVEVGGDARLHKFNIATKTSQQLGTLHVNVLTYSDFAVDVTRGFCYLSSSYNVYQYNLSSLNGYTATVKPYVLGQPSTGQVYGVTVMENGDVMALCQDTDGCYLYRIKSFTGNGSVEFAGWIDGMSLAMGSTEFAYDPATKDFYVTDPANHLYSFKEEWLYDKTDRDYNSEDPQTPATLLGPVGSGLTVNGLAILRTNAGTQAAGMQKLEAMPLALPGKRTRA